MHHEVPLHWLEYQSFSSLVVMMSAFCLTAKESEWAYVRVDCKRKRERESARARIRGWGFITKKTFKNGFFFFVSSSCSSIPTSSNIFFVIKINQLSYRFCPEYWEEIKDENRISSQFSWVLVCSLSLSLLLICARIVNNKIMFVMI